jgi:aminoglycoside phosphotransferase (APT) family kinase protein
MVDPATPQASLREAGLARVLEHLGADRVLDVSRLYGGASGLVDRVELITQGRREAVVIKRFPIEARHAARFEWEAMGFVAPQSIPSPQPLAFDPDGSWFGAPAIVMGSLPGQPTLKPIDEERWTAELATCLAGIHRVPVDGAPSSMQRPPIWQRWSPGDIRAGLRSDAIVAALETLGRIHWRRGLCHGDFHPANVLFDAGRVSGVVDWVSARQGPLLSDVGRCRCALAIWVGASAADLFARHYAELTGRPLDGLFYWDIVSGAITVEQARPWTDPQWSTVYGGLGGDLDPDLARRRAIAFLDTALERARLSGR